MKKAIRAFLALYSWRYPQVLVYMLQNVDYRASPYLAWYWQTNDFSRVMYRRSLEPTRPAQLLLIALRTGIFMQLATGLTLLVLWQRYGVVSGLAFGLAFIVSYPVLWAHLIVVPLALGRALVIQPRERIMIMESRKIFEEHPGIKIAIAGSYGKTSMKELLLSILASSKKVAATPANMNVPISHARFAQKLTGDEDVLLIEYGEEKPGDVGRFARTTQPEIGIITGVAAAHLDHYKAVENAAKDIFSLADFVPADALFVNSEPEAAKPFIKSKFQTYDRGGALGWKVHDTKISVNGTSFLLKKGKQELHIKSGLVGQHQVGPLAFAAAFANELGVSRERIESAIAKTKPFEHRMQPYQLHGAWIIDDTYNGNIEGIKAGAELLKTLSGKRKIYITPGLVGQGESSAATHQEMGRLIAAANPDVVVLMEHSVTPDIQKGLDEAGYHGELFIESDPLNFYQNLKAFVAHGDLVVMQNDWPDNYR